MKRSRLIALLLTALMMLSVAATGVFALDETGTPEPAGEGNVEAVLDAPAVQGESTGTVEEEESAPETVEVEPLNEQTRDTNLQVDITPSGNKLIVTWGETTEAATIKVFVGTSIPTDETTPVKEATISEGETSKTFEGLDYDTDYAVGVYKTDGEILGFNTKKTEPKPTPPAAPTINTYPGYHRVFVKWNDVGATSYTLYRSVDGNNYSAIYSGSYKEMHEDTDNAADITYYYYVVASNEGGSTQSSIVSGTRVRTCTYKITFKKAVKLTSHDGSKTKHTFKKGQVVYADGFSQGKYQFDYDGHRYHAKWMRIKSPSGIYSRNAYENGLTPTRYVNDTGYGSPTGYLIWISLYSQRVYIFQGSAGNWTLVNYDAYGNEGWQCGSGKAKTPTPTGMNKSLHKKMKKYSKHKWWNCFSGNNAIHGSNGQKEIKKLGKLISNGCVRVTNDQAIWIFNNVPKKTRVLVF